MLGPVIIAVVLYCKGAGLPGGAETKTEAQEQDKWNYDEPERERNGEPGEQALFRP
jgi:hypothetical protein